MTSSTEEVRNTAEDEFLAELKSQFDKDIDLRKTIENKANTMITVASGVSTLLIAIGLLRSKGSVMGSNPIRATF
jgi:predicted  nucleic acid-binding Zn-ribbon protein